MCARVCVRVCACACVCACARVYGAVHRLRGTVHSCTGRCTVAGDGLIIGARKSQMAHSEGAAGMAGLMKIAHVLQWCAVPPNLQLMHTNTALHLDILSVFLPTQSAAVQGGAKSNMGVSSFGYSGTNSHAVLSSQTTVNTPVLSESPTSKFQHSQFTWRVSSTVWLCATPLVAGHADNTTCW
jgi:acyl transferase domain-containing protein